MRARSCCGCLLRCAAQHERQSSRGPLTLSMPKRSKKPRFVFSFCPKSMEQKPQFPWPLGIQLPGRKRLSLLSLVRADMLDIELVHPWLAPPNLFLFRGGHFEPWYSSIHEYICLYVHTHAHIHTNIHTYIPTYINTLHIHAYIHAYMHIYMGMYVCMYARMHACMYVCMYVCMCVCM